MSRKVMPCPTPEDLRDCLESTSDPNPMLADHLACCSHCQATLTFVAGQETWWEEAQQFLSIETDPIASRISSRVCPLTTSDSASHANSDVLLAHELQQFQNLLDKPSHPELLGRIGRYELEQLVGRGGMGLVFRAHDTELHRVVAVKTLALHLIPIGAARERFVRESRACAALAHPHIVPMYDVVHEGAVPALVMQYIAGSSLQAWLNEHGPMTWQESLKLACQLADALACAHQNGVVHRDIKPANVLLEANGSRALLTDFGLARVLDAATMTQSGILTGTPEYMSPEQAQGKTVDERSDLFALGSLLYTMLTGHSPFRAAEPMAILHRVCHSPHTPLHRVNAEIPLEVSKLVDRMLAKTPNNRFASANELRDAMLVLLRTPRRLIGPMKMNSIAVVGVIGAIVFVLCFAWFTKPTLSWMTNRQQPQNAPRSVNRPPDIPESIVQANAKEAERVSETANESTLGVFDDFQTIDGELLRLKEQAMRISRPPDSVSQEFAGSTKRDDSVEIEVERLRRDLKRLEAERQ